MEQLDRITQQPDVMGGKACIRGLRVTVGMVVGQMVRGTVSMKSSPTTPTSSARISCRRCATPMARRRTRGRARHYVKLLVDMNLSPRWAAVLAGAGIEATHWSTLGAHDARDSAIMTYASVNDYVVLTHDLDFSAILAATRSLSLSKPRALYAPSPCRRQLSTSILKRSTLALLQIGV